MEPIFTPELIEKARQARSTEELIALAKEHGVEMSEEGAKAYFEKLNGSGEMSDEELDNVSGGGCGSDPPCPCCGRPLHKSNYYPPYHYRCRECDKWFY